MTTKITTTDLMDIALELAGLDFIPEDSGIQAESGDVRRILAGIDMGATELLVAHQLGYDCVARHHPQGLGNTRLGVLESRAHCNLLIRAGVPVNIAQKIAKAREKDISRRVKVSNLEAPVQMALLLGVASISIHTPADMLVERDLQARIDGIFAKNPMLTLNEIIANICEIREFKNHPQGPEIWVGDEKSLSGKVIVSMAGGGAPNLDEYKAMIDAGIGTFVVMHMKPEIADDLAKDGRCNVVVAGHMPSDSYGFNRILDAWELKGVEITRIGGIV